MFLDFIPSFLRGSVSIYFAKYVLGFNAAAASVFLAVGMVANVGGAYLTLVFAHRFCKMTVYKCSKFVCIMLLVVLFLLPVDQIALIYIAFIVLCATH